jgi:DNA-binding FadR family transcriptional regulator
MEIEPWQVTEARKRHEERKHEEIARLGEEGYARRQEAKQAVFNELKTRLDLLAEDAKKRDFVYFRTLLDLHKNTSIRLQFGNGKGKFYERSVGLERLVTKHLRNALLTEYSDIEALVHSYVRNLPGIAMLDHGMQVERVRATEG